MTTQQEIQELEELYAAEELDAVQELMDFAGLCAFLLTVFAVVVSL